jgi:hypothetical protein
LLPRDPSEARVYWKGGMSIVPKETIEVIAQSVGIPTLPADVSAALAPDVEYRLREIMQVRRPAPCPCAYS